MNDCIFCKIVKGEIPSEKVYEDERVLAFYDLNPLAPVHVLVIPKLHVESCNAVTEDVAPYLSAIFCAIPKIAESLGVAEDGYRVITNVGRHGCQSVKHLHFHLLGGVQLSEKIL